MRSVCRVVAKGRITQKAAVTNCRFLNATQKRDDEEVRKAGKRIHRKMFPFPDPFERVAAPA